MDIDPDTGAPPGTDAQHWTPQTRARYDTAAQQALDALTAHVAAVRQADPGTRVEGADGSPVEGAEPAQEDTGVRLTLALDALAEAEFDLTGDFPYILDLELDEEDDDDAADPSQIDGAEAEVVSVMMRIDFAVEDEQALLAAAREAVVEHDEMEVEDADRSITEVESAIFAVSHARGWDVLLDDAVPGLAALTVYAEVVTDGEPLEVEFEPE